MSKKDFRFADIIENLEEDSRAKLTKHNPDIDGFATGFALMYPGLHFYTLIETLAKTIYAWKNDGVASGTTRFQFEKASLKLSDIQREYDQFTFTEVDKDLVGIVDEVAKWTDPLEKLESINSMLTSRYMRTINEKMSHDEKFKVSEQIKFLVGLRDTIKNDIDSKVKFIPAHEAPEMETVYREIYSDVVVLKKSKILKIVVEDDVKEKLYKELSENLDTQSIHICRRKNTDDEGNYDIVITSDRKKVKPRQIHFEPCDAKKLIELFKSIVRTNTCRAKFVQAIRPNAWYSDLIGKEFFVCLDELDRPLALLPDPRTVWQMDSRLLKDKYVDVLSVTRTKKIESKQVPKGSVVKWE